MTDEPSTPPAAPAPSVANDAPGLKDIGVADARSLARMTAQQRGLAFADAEQLFPLLDRATALSLPRRYLEHEGCVPICKNGDTVVVAATDVIEHPGEIARALGAHVVDVRIVTSTDLHRLIRAVDLGQVDNGERASTVSHRARDLMATSEAPASAELINLFDAILLDAIAQRASDIHLEVYGERVRVRLRIDGDLHDVGRYHLTVTQLRGVMNVVKVNADAPADFVCFTGRGCERCNGIGTRGRVAVVEHLPTDPSMRRAIAKDLPVDDLRAAARAAGLTSMRSQAPALVTSGVIPFDELQWVLPADQLCDSMVGRPEFAHVVPGFLSLHGVAHTGATGPTLCLTKRKHDVKAVLMREDLPTPRFQVIDDAQSFELRLAPPVILKLTGEHASVGIDAGAVCWTTDEVRARARALWAVYRQPVLIEEFVDGRELFVSCIGRPLRALPFMEQGFDHIPAGFLRMRTFDTKWFDVPDLGGDRPLLNVDERWQRPVPLRTPIGDAAPLAQIEVIARRALEAVGARDWGRVDFRLDAGGTPMIIDITPNSYWHPNSPCALAAKDAGLDYDEAIAIVVGEALTEGGANV